MERENVVDGGRFDAEALGAAKGLSPLLYSGEG
jgi:hypothetical protein